MNGKAKKVVVFFCVLFFGLFVDACLPFAAEGMETMLRAAFEPNLPPYQFLEDGKPVGIHIDLLNKIADNNNYIIEYIPMSSTVECIEALNYNDVDMVLGISLNDNEKYREQLTESISQSYICIVASRQNAYNIRNDIDVTSFIVALQNNTIGYSYIRNLRNLRYVVTSNQVTAFNLLTTSRTNLLVGVKHSILYQMEKAGIANDYTIVNDYIVPIEYSIAVRSGNNELLESLNEEIKSLKIKGEYEAVQNRWINENASAVRAVIGKILKIAAVVLCCILIVTIFNMRLNFLLKKQVDEKTAELKKINIDLQNQIVQTRNHNELKNCIVENSPSGIVVFDTSYHITLANNNFIQMIGSSHELTGCKITEIDFLNSILSGKINDIFAHRALFTNEEITVKGKEGEDIICRYDIYQLYNFNNDIRGAILMIDDVTEEVRLKEQLYEKDKSRALNQIVAGIAHEIRNPLTAIKTFVELIPVKKDNERFQQRICDVVPREVDRVSDLIKNLIDYAKPDNGHKDKTDVAAIVQSSIELLWHMLKNKKIVLNKNIEPNTYIWVDSSQIKQVLINVILNGFESMMAVKTGSEPLYIDIKAWKDEKNVYIQIIDDGEGMTREEIKKCTEPFFTTKSSGTGLGMYVSKQYVEQNEGELMIESEKNVYTKITLKFRRVYA